MKNHSLFILICLLLFLTACSVPRTPATPTPTETPEPTETPIPEPTPTIPPSAAKVNGLYIAIEDVEMKTAQLRDAYSELGQDIPDDAALKSEALEELINETLFLSAAQKQGAAPSSAELDEKIQNLCSTLGSCEALQNWQSQNHYTSEDCFRRSLERETAAANMRESIFASLNEMEQLHVYRIWSYTRSDLNDVLNRLNMGISFTELAKNYDPATGGDMNWFPRGVLFSGDLEDKIFSLNTNEHTEIIEADGVYNIFYVAEKQTGRAMDTQVEQIARRKAMSDWLDEQKKQAEIEIF